MKTFRTLTLGLCVAALAAVATPSIASTAPATPAPAKPAITAAAGQSSANVPSSLASLFTVQNNTPPGPGAPGGDFGNNQGQPGGGGYRGGGGGYNNTVLMTVAPDGNVYILRGNTLFKISPDMKILGQVTLPMPPRPQFGPDNGGPRDGAGGGQANPNSQGNPPPPAQ